MEPDKRQGTGAQGSDPMRVAQEQEIEQDRAILDLHQAIHDREQAELDRSGPASRVDPWGDQQPSEKQRHLDDAQQLIDARRREIETRRRELDVDPRS